MSVCCVSFDKWCLVVTLTVASLFLALALWFLGLTDIRWRAAEVSRQLTPSAGELKSDGGSTTDGTDETGGGKGWEGNWGIYLVGAGLGMGESGREDGWNMV